MVAQALDFHERAQPLVEELDALAERWQDAAAARFDAALFGNTDDRPAAEADLAAATEFNGEVLVLLSLMDQMAPGGRP